MNDDYKPSPGGDIDLSQVVSTGKPSLADMSVVDKLVRDFAASVVMAKTGFQRGLEGARNPLAIIEERARDAGAVIMGRDDRFDAQPWNADNRLGNTIRVLLPNEVKHYGDTGTALFMWLANQVLKASASLDDGMDEAAVKGRLAPVLDDVVARILGVR